MINDLNPVKELHSLISLDISNNNVSDLSPIFGLPKLEKLDISNNPIKSLKGLEKIKTLWDLKFDDELLKNEDSEKVVALMGRRNPVILKSLKEEFGDEYNKYPDEIKKYSL